MVTESPSTSSPERVEEDSMPFEESENEMDEQKFLEKWTYNIRSDFTSSSGMPATWAAGHPKHWGQEKAKVRLDGDATTPTLSPDDQFVAVGIGKEIQIFRVGTQERVEVLHGHPGEVVTVLFAPGLVQGSSGNARYLLASQSEEEGVVGGFIMIWGLDHNGRQVSSSLTGKPEQSPSSFDVDSPAAADGSFHQFPGELGSFGSPIFSPDSKTMVYVVPNITIHAYSRECQSQPSVNLWDVESRSLRHELRGHTDAVMWIGISPDGSLAASISWDGTARIWDIGSGDAVHILGPLDGQLWCGAFSPDSKHLAVSQGDPASIYIYDLTTAQAISRLEIPTWMRSMAWSPDGALFAGGLENGTLGIWDPYAGMKQLQLWSLGFEDEMMQDYATIEGVRFIDGGQKLMFRILEGTVEVYDFKTNTKQQFTRSADDKIAKCPRGEMVCSKDSRLLVVPDVDGALRLWSL
ncbi:WD40 repeat domain-containing protein [Aspergillus thermomutatus]|uniref:Uncharacterized protein n=1 Tax=Aspergillus thermomutatus TaxID=41047 RepID=A0A397H6Z2_ASPTH|nr:uncharacterized protein CDV56_107160 [Aspergillus thermomutatus]RHZ57688.1 hypothetical protein CDV56_107160 [Aspergillus thermomutatus]